MSNSIVKYEELYEVITFSKKKYYIKAENVKILDEMVETKKFVQFGDSRVNVSSIDTYEPATQEINEYKELTKNLNDSQKRDLSKRIKIWEKEQDTKADARVIQEAINKYILKI